MMTVPCDGCQAEVTRENSFEVSDGKLLCVDCFTELGQKMMSSGQALVTGKNKEVLRRKIKEEMAGIIPRELLRDLFETGIRKILIGKEEPEDVYGWLVNQTEAMCGPALQRYRIKMLGALRTAMDDSLEKEEQEARADLKKYIDFGAV